MTTYEVNKRIGESVDDYVGDDEEIISTHFAGGTEYVEVQEVEGHECEECGEVFDTERGLWGHQSKHTEDN